ncbi:TIGR03936 family radical SAM-associated protein [Planctomycetota bacterium]
MKRIKIRFRFSKEGDLIYISHQDLLRLFERGFRRAGFPLYFSEGFNPHPKISIISALGLGIEGKEEAGEVILREPVETDSFIAAANAAMPPEIRLISAEIISPSIKTQPAGAEYCVQNFHPPPDSGAVTDLMAQSRILVSRRKQATVKQVDIRPYLEDIRLEGRDTLIIKTKITPAGTARVDEILRVLGIDPGANGIHISRKRLYFECQASKKENHKKTELKKTD